jgi:hypothetical protein
VKARDVGAAVSTGPEVAVTVMAKVAVPVLPQASWATSVKLYVPAVVGVPEMA